jgi:putative addiction module component (TIGR02574 family)
MTDIPPPFDFSHLAVAERIELAQQLWDGILPHADRVPITEAQR